MKANPYYLHHALHLHDENPSEATAALIFTCGEVITSESYVAIGRCHPALIGMLLEIFPGAADDLPQLCRFKNTGIVVGGEGVDPGMTMKPKDVHNVKLWKALREVARKRLEEFAKERTAKKKGQA